MVVCLILWETFAWPAIWLGATVLFQLVALLSLFIVCRAGALIVRWLPERNWLRARQLRPVSARQLVLITGASSGIGLALAKYLHRLGYSVAAAHLPNVNEPGLEELRELARGAGGLSGGVSAGGKEAKRSPQQQPQQSNNRMFLLELDVCDSESIAAAYAHVERLIVQHQLELLALINNAGLGSLQPFAWLQRKKITRLIETNLTGGLLMAREFLPLLARKSRQPDTKVVDCATRRLIFVSSGLGFVPGPTYATYGATKAAQIYVAKCLNLELKQRFGVQAVAVIPHNFIKSTSICAQNVQTNKAAWDELRPVERQLYKQDFDTHCELARSLEEATKVHQEQARQTGLVRSKGIEKRCGKMGQTGALSLFGQIVASLKGENRAASLEESGALEGFELALRLREPPEVVFAGDAVFQLLVGSLLLALPNSLTGLLSRSVAPSLYR